MRTAGLAVLLAASAAAQTGLPGYDKPAEQAPPTAPAVSTDTVAASTAPAGGDDAAGRGFKVGGDEPKPKLARPMHATIHKDAVDWEPLGLKTGGDPGQAENAAALKVVKVSGRMKGENSKATASARVHPGRKDSKWLIVSVRPKSLVRRSTHIEIRFRIFEGFVEEVEASAVTITDRRGAPKKPLDSRELREAGLEFQEEKPGSGMVIVSALDPRPGSGVNAGRLEKAEFGDKDLGFVNLSWSAKGVAGAKPAKKK